MTRIYFRAALAAALLCVTLFPSAARAAEGDVPALNAALLTRDLGDPRRPGNVKLVVGLPEELARETAKARPEDFRIYVHPAALSREEGLTDRYRADGLYLWRHRGRLFLDARGVPAQDDEGEAAVRVVYAPGGEPLAEGVAEGSLRYTSEFVDVVLAVDVSRSMLYNDPNKRRVTAARAFIDMARQGGGIGRVGLVTFNHRANSVTPLLPLEDGERLIGALDTVGADGLTNLDGPLRNALDMLEGSRKPVIILLSDGRNEGSRYRDTHLEAASRGARIFSVGLTEEADHELLKEMADATGGIYFRAVRDADLPEIYARLAAELGKRQLLTAETLDAAYGEKTYPVDATVTRLVALADGGAQVAAIGGGGMFTTGMSGVLMGKPAPGEWTFAWSNAAPGVSTLALFGETQFFLDVFPPQMLGDRLSVGATLAERDNPLAGGSVWIEPLPGVLAERMELFDDGRHGDGGADDGVYAGNTVVPDAPRRFDLTIRAEGEAWDSGGFIRQTAGLAIRMPVPPPEAKVSLDSDIDFGVLFPGETGVADVNIELNAPGAKDLSLDLTWDTADEGWPDFASRLSVDPGRQAFELEITIPESARPGDYAGAFRVGDGGDIDEESRARVTVGTVEFTAPGAIDLGAVPPGTFVSRALEIPYRADKTAGLAIDIDDGGSGDVAATSDANMLSAGQGSVPLEIVVTALIDRAEGDCAATVRLAAGPGVVDIPLTWRVRQYAAAAPELTPIAGLPAAPELPARTAPLAKPSGLDDELWQNDPSGADTGAPDAIASPWDSTEQLLRRPGGGLSGGDGSGLANAPAVGDAVFAFPETPADSGDGASFWSAWWLYILAALLLLLLLLLLIAYLLYRLGKSAMARFLLVSALANIILMLVFIALLSVGESMPAARAAPIAVTLVEEELPVEVTLSPAEESLLGRSGAETANAGSSGGGSSMSAAAGEASVADALAAGASGGQLAETKEARLPENEAAETELADARQPSAMPLDQNENRQLRRDNRLADRSGRSADMPAPELAAMDGPAAASEAARSTDTATDTESIAEASGARLEIQADTPSERPVWSTGERPLRSLASDEGLLLAEAAGMETISPDRTVRRMEPRGSRRNPDATATAKPEPRVEIDDPARHSTEAPSPSGADAAEGDPGVAEVRVALRAVGSDEIGRKPGALLTPGASRLSDSIPDRTARGIADASGVPELSRPVGGARTARGASAKENDSQPGVASAAPGAASGNGNGTGGGASANASAANASSSSRSGGANGVGGAAGEQRFDDAPSQAASGGDGVPGGTGGARTPATAAGGGGSGSSPSPLATGGGGSSPADYVPANGTGGGAQGGTQRSNGSSNNRPGNRSGRSDAGSPAGSDSVPGSSGGSSNTAQTNNGNGNGNRDGGDDASSTGRGRRGGAGTGEGRFDDLGGSGDGTENTGRRGGAIAGGGSADLASAGGGDGLGIISYDSGDNEWQRIDRRPRARNMAVAASAVDMDSLLIIVGDFTRLPDAAAENLFARFARFSGQGLTVEERLLSASDDNLSDTLLALATPEQAASWSDADLRNVARYLEQGGHIWLDAANRAQAQGAMERLAAATDGDFAPLPATHQLAENADVDALYIGDTLAAIATCRDWRKDWRFAEDSDDRIGDGALRFFVRTVNYFLSGDADSGIVLAPGAPAGGTLVQPYREIIPESLAAAQSPSAEATAVWDDFAPETVASWRMPDWSDPVSISAVSDGQGARALKLDLDASAPGAARKGRAAVSRTFRPVQDLSGASAVIFDAYYDGSGDASLSMVFTVNEDGAWHDYETPQTRLAAGWNSLRFTLDGADFRALTPGVPGDSLSGEARARTGRAGFLLYRDGGSAAIALVRNLRLVRK